MVTEILRWLQLAVMRHRDVVPGVRNQENYENTEINPFVPELFHDLPSK